MCMDWYIGKYLRLDQTIGDLTRIPNSGFWFVNILLQKFNTSSKKEVKMIKAHHGK